MLFHRLGAVAFEHFHIAGIRRGAVEDLCPQRGFTHFLSEIGIFHSGETKPLVTVGEPEIPQPLGLGLGFQAFKDFGLTVGVLPAVALADFGVIRGLHRHDLVADHRRHPIQKRAVFAAHTQVHVHPGASLCCFPWRQHGAGVVSLSSRVTGRHGWIGCTGQKNGPRRARLSAIYSAASA